MAYKISKVDVWAADIVNKPGMLARVLEAVSNAGAKLEFMIARKASDTTSRVFISPIKGKKVKQAAQDVGLVPAQGMHTLCVEAPDRPGLGAEITRAVAAQGINLRGASAAAAGKKAMIYLAFDNAEDSEKAVKVVKKAMKGGKKGK